MRPNGIQMSFLLNLNLPSGSTDSIRLGRSARRYLGLGGWVSTNHRNACRIRSARVSFPSLDLRANCFDMVKSNNLIPGPSALIGGRCVDFHEGNQIMAASSDLEMIDKNQHRLEEAAENQ